MQDVNFADLDGRFDETPPELVGMYPLGGGGLLEAPYRHYFELRHLKRIVPFHRRMNVLELGSGNGRWAVSIAPLVAHYTGVDVTPRAVEVARAAVVRANIENAEFHEQSILDFEGARPYDVVYFAGVSQYLQDDELHAVLRNLSPWLKPETVIVDRSSVNYERRELLQREGYYSILRTPRDLDAIFAVHGFHLTYYAPSYRFLRGAGLLTLPRLQRPLAKAVNRTRPLSLHLLWMLSWIVDVLRPVSALKRGWSHDFMLFQRGSGAGDAGRR